MEDEHGPINVIVKPDIYQRDRSAVRMEPFLAVKGRLQKDGETINVIACEIEALRVPGAPVRRRGLSRSYATAGVRRDGTRSTKTVEPAPAGVREGVGVVHWADTEAEKPVPDPYRYLTALRQSPPGVKNFG
jgi:hypothetical protein